MKFISALGLFIGAFFLQTSFLASFRIFGVSPNLILCLLIVMTFLYDDITGVTLAVVFSLMVDVQFMPIIGIGPLCCLTVFFGILVVRGLLYRDNALSMIFMSILATTVYTVLYWLLGAVFGPAYGFFYMLKTLPMLLVWHTAVCLPIYLVLRRNLLRHPRDRYV